MEIRNCNMLVAKGEAIKSKHGSHWLITLVAKENERDELS